MKKRLFLSIILFFGMALFFVSSDAQAASQTLFRVYNPNSGEHFYTKDTNERNHLIKVGWHDEGVAWDTPSSGITVYRVYNPNAGDHHYTMDKNEYDHLAKVGWRKEGEAFKSVDRNSKEKPIGIPVYRAYNPNAKSGAHNFTINQYEQKHLIKVGWRDEKIAFYAHHGSNDYYKIKVVHKSGKTLLKEATTSVKEGFNYVARAENFPGYELVGSSTKELKNITSSQEIVFNYNKVDKDKLTSALKSLDSLTEADYTPISWEKLMGSKDAATDIVNKKDATQKEVNDRLTDLNARIKELVKRADTQDLQTLYLGAKGMGPHHYQDYPTYLLFHAAYANAYTKIEDLNSPQKDVDDALAELQRMIGLAKADAPQTLLDELQSLYNTGIAKRQEDFTPVTWRELSASLAVAKDILDSERPIEETAQASLNRLKDAIDNLVEKADKTDLQALYDSSQGLGPANFGSYDDYLEYHAAVGDARNVLADDSHSQQRVDECLTALQTAMNKRTV